MYVYYVSHSPYNVVYIIYITSIQIIVIWLDESGSHDVK